MAGNYAVSTAAMAAGMATLKAAGYPGFTATNEALISAAIGLFQRLSSAFRLAFAPAVTCLLRDYSLIL